MTKRAALLPPPSWGRVGVGVVLSTARLRQAEPPRPHPNPPPPRGRESNCALELIRRLHKRYLLAGIAGIGHQAGCGDAFNGADFVPVGGIAADADRAHDLARLVADQDAALRRHDLALAHHL